MLFTQDFCDLSAETCNRETTEMFFGFFFLFALRPPPTGSFNPASGSAERHLSGPVAAGETGIDPGQSKHNEGEAGPPPPLLNQLRLGPVFLVHGQKAEFSADAEIIHCAASDR